MCAPLARAQETGPPDPTPFESRGRLVESHRATLQDDIQRLRARVLDTLRVSAPDLAPRLDPAPPPVAQGYGLLPRILPEAPQPADTGHRASLYSWPWTDTLIARASTRLEALGQRLVAGPKTRPDYETLVTEFNGVVADRKLIDAHVEHNWFWQRAIFADSARFLRATLAIGDALTGKRVDPPAAGMPRVPMTLEDSGTGPAIIRVPVGTDIEDSAFVHTAVGVIEHLWQTTLDGREYRIVVEPHFVTPRSLYCGGAAASCAPPERGTVIDIPGHVARFPASLAVMTTGGTQPYVLGGRALILGPRDLAPRTFGHEFGHLLGFEDAYLRGFQNLRDDGYAIIELIPDRADIMAESGFGAVQPRHIRQIVDNLRAERAMKAGLDALYTRNDAKAAVSAFREVLALKPEHYGATFQLAKALDASGERDAAVPIWRRMLAMSQAAGDGPTIDIVKKRLGIPD